MLQNVAIDRSATPFNPDATLCVVIEMSLSSWHVAGLLPEVERRRWKKMSPDEVGLLALIERWCAEAADTCRTITRIVLASEAGRDGFWPTRCAEACGFEAHVIHASSIAVSREPRRAKTDRLDTVLLMRVLLGSLRGERGHCSMVAVLGLDADTPSGQRVNARTSLASAPACSTA